MSRSVQYVNSANESITLSLSPFAIVKIDGLGVPSIDLQTQKAPYQDGVTYIDALLESREINIELVINAPNDFEKMALYRRELVAIMSPKLGVGSLIYINEHGDQYAINVIPTAIVFPNKAYQDPFPRAMVTLTACDPYWTQIADNQIEIETLDPLTEFPIEFVSGGIALSAYLVGTPVTIVNAGEVSTPVLITFYGPATKPKIENQTTGEYILIDKTFTSSESMVIDTSFGNKTVKIYTSGVESNGMQYLNITSTFWQLSRGTNLVRFTDDSSSTTARAMVEWRERYAGV